MKTPLYTGQFRRDVKRMEKRGKDMSKLRKVIVLLLEASPLPERLRDHPLRGEWAGCRDLHIEPDWLLIYNASEDNVLLERTGTHSDLFDE
jgi:mRNA interferase YafQ